MGEACFLSGAGGEEAAAAEACTTTCRLAACPATGLLLRQVALWMRGGIAGQPLHTAGLA